MDSEEKIIVNRPSTEFTVADWILGILNFLIVGLLLWFVCATAVFRLIGPILPNFFLAGLIQLAIMVLAPIVAFMNARSSMLASRARRNERKTEWDASRRRAGYCPRCDYDLTANTSGVCPECGEVLRTIDEPTDPQSSR